MLPPIHESRMLKIGYFLLSVFVLQEVTAWSNGHHQQPKKKTTDSSTTAPSIISRRQYIVISAAGASLLAPSILTTAQATAAASEGGPLARRLEQDILLQQAPIVVGDNLNGVDNLFYPSYLAGTWDVTQTLIQSSTPLGPIYLGGPNGDKAIAEKAIAESQANLNRPVKLQLRYISTKWGVAEDRLFNTKNRLDSFAGRSVVSNVAYNDVGSSNRAKVLEKGGSGNDPLLTTFVRFKGPAAQKTFVTSHASDPIANDTENDNNSIWMGTESQRSIFALTNENTAAPIFTDTETVWQFQKLDKDSLKGRLRIASYLNAQQDKLYFESRNRAVSLLDYALDMKRID
mmetsp:Transcript_18159/g.49574  ORF Transcript_18159/g.49574 Transcript_18159/m.49574 type:complete len:345 (+) Transcript_18159:48-1082(+)